ncbi:MAG TPA: transglutaminase domain-containing protein, partial [Roseiflexaceae bacterium]
IKPHIPWYLRWDLPVVLPGVILAAIMLWSVTRSIAVSNWADGLEVLTGVTLPAMLVGMVFARLRWLPAWLAHLLSAALGLAWAIQRIGPLLVNAVAQELGAPVAGRLVTWGDRASEILIRTAIWLRILEAGGRGEDIVLFVVALALLMWALGYATGWLLFRAGWAWWAVLLSAFTILVNYTFASPKPNQLFFIFLGSALLLIVQQNVVKHQHRWRSASVEYPEFMPWRFLVAATLFCSLIVLATSLLPGSVSSTQVARAWRKISLPLTAAREGWEKAFSTINAPPGSSGGGFATTSIRAGGPRALGDAVVLRIRSPKYDYWRAVSWDKYTGQAWQGTVGDRARAALGFTTEIEARSPIQAGAAIPQADLAGRTLITQTVELVNPFNNDLLIFGGQFSWASIPVLIQNGVLTTDSGQPAPNFDETAAVFAETPLQQTGTYTIAAYISTVDEQSLREAGMSYPDWVSGHYLQLPDSVTERTRAKAREIVQLAGVTAPYDQARAIQDYLRGLTYDETRPAPPAGRDWADYFLFTTQRGYCDDFATAMVVLLRSLNIPARLSQGYAGGTLDPQLNAYVVRESVGHSWPEVYFPGYGWQRFEPTPASYASVPVRPANPAANSDANNPAAPSLSQQEAADRLRRLEQQDENSLRDASIDFEAIRRAQAERAAQEQLRQLVIAGGILAALLAGVGLFFVSLRRELRGLSPATAAYVRLGRLAAWAGLPQEWHVTPYEYAGEIGRSLPEQRGAIERIVRAYVAERYRPAGQPGDDNPSPDSGQDLEQDWLAIRKPLLARLVSRIGAVARPRTPPGRRR